MPTPGKQDGCLRTERVGGGCQQCGMDTGRVAHVVADTVLCSACCPVCRQTEGRGVGQILKTLSSQNALAVPFVCVRSIPKQNSEGGLR